MTRSRRSQHQGGDGDVLVVLGLDNLLGVFLILVAGLELAVLVFAGELLVHKHRHRLLAVLARNREGIRRVRHRFPAARLVSRARGRRWRRTTRPPARPPARTRPSEPPPGGGGGGGGRERPGGRATMGARLQALPQPGRTAAASGEWRRRCYYTR